MATSAEQFLHINDTVKVLGPKHCSLYGLCDLSRSGFCLIFGVGPPLYSASDVFGGGLPYWSERVPTKRGETGAAKRRSRNRASGTGTQKFPQTAMVRMTLQNFHIAGNTPTLHSWHHAWAKDIFGAVLAVGWTFNLPDRRALS